MNTWRKGIVIMVIKKEIEDVLRNKELFIEGAKKLIELENAQKN